jgi:hypothetical protein
MPDRTPYKFPDQVETIECKMQFNCPLYFNLKITVSLSISPKALSLKMKSEKGF